MRKFMTILAVSGVAAIVPAAPALADGSIGADGVCTAGVPDGNGGYIGVAEGTYFSRSTKSGVANFTCKFDLPPELTPSSHVKTSDFPCLVSLGGNVTELADDQRINASPGGKMSMVCTIRP
jgi:hypothetical protein